MVIHIGDHFRDTADLGGQGKQQDQNGEGDDPENDDAGAYGVIEPVAEDVRDFYLAELDTFEGTQCPQVLPLQYSIFFAGSVSKGSK